MFFNVRLTGFHLDFILATLFLISCKQSVKNTEEASSSNHDDYDNKIVVNGVEMTRSYRDNFNKDSLLAVHKDSILFMNYWAGITKKEWAMVTQEHVSSNELLRDYNEGGEGDSFYTILSIGDTNYFFSVELVEPEDSRLQNRIKIQAGSKTRFTNVEAYKNNKKVWDSDPGLNLLYAHEYDVLHDFFHSKYSKMPSIYLDVGREVAGGKEVNRSSPNRRRSSGQRYEWLKVKYEYKIDNNKAVCYREVPYPNNRFKLNEKDSIPYFFEVIYRSKHDLKSHRAILKKDKDLELQNVKDLNEQKKESEKKSKEMI